MRAITADDVPEFERRLQWILAQFESGEIAVCDLVDGLERFNSDLVKREGELWDARVTEEERTRMESFLRRRS